MPEVRELSVRLRESTAERHAAVESLPFFLALRADELPVQSVVSYLRGLAIVHAVLESCLNGGSGLSRELWRPGMERLPELLATFEAADVARLPDVPRAIDAALRLGDRILLAAHEPVRLLGPLYVLEGSQLGGQVLRRHLAAALGLAKSRVAYGGEGSTVPARWRSFKDALDALPLGSCEVEGILAAAQATFDGIAGLAQAAFPYDESELRHRVTALNPEAGRHAMPQSEVEIARALRCAEIAWSRFPYLEMRFGERGRRFTSSDSCWLVTLRGLDEESRHRLLSWLRELLANRGLPGVILEHHLEEIDADCRARPAAEGPAGAAFRFVIERFRAESETLLPLATRAAMIERWDRRLGECDGRVVPGAAEILVAAWLDSLAGATRAWEATYPWFCDPARFSGSWIEAVAGLAEELKGRR